MATKKKLNEIAKLEANLYEEHASWLYIFENGWRDPFWADGTNLNLIRNHIIYFKGKLEHLCNEFGRELPDICKIPIPEEVDEDYIALKSNKQRVERLYKWGIIAKRTLENFEKRIQPPVQTTIF